MEVSFEIDKVIKCAVYNTAFFPSGGGVDDVLMRLSLIKPIIKDVNLMCISFSVKHPKIFWESWMSLSNMSRTISDIYTYPFNPQLVIKTYQKIKGTFICGPLFSKWMGVFQSWLDCFSIGVWAFIQNINFLSSVAFVYWGPFVIIFKCCNL